MEQTLHQAEVSVALLYQRDPPVPREPVFYRSEAAALRRIRSINKRLDELADEQDEALGLVYCVPIEAGLLARVLDTRLDPRAPSQERLINHGQ